MTVKVHLHKQTYGHVNTHQCADTPLPLTLAPSNLGSAASHCPSSPLSVPLLPADWASVRTCEDMQALGRAWQAALLSPP